MSEKQKSNIDLAQSNNKKEELKKLKEEISTQGKTLSERLDSKERFSNNLATAMIYLTNMRSLVNSLSGTVNMPRLGSLQDLYNTSRALGELIQDMKQTRCILSPGEITAFTNIESEYHKLNIAFIKKRDAFN